MCSCQFVTWTMMMLVASAFAAKPLLHTNDHKSVSAKFRGIEWSDDTGAEDIPLTAKVVTTRIAKMPWGAVFKVEFKDLKSGAEKQREIRPEYFVVTENRIVLLNEEDNDVAARNVSAMDKPPEFQPNDVYGISSGSFEHQEAEWKTT